MTHFAELCGCGIVLSTCRCPALNKKLTVRQVCEHNDNWAQKLELELNDQYGIAANTNIRPHGQNLDVELNGVKQILTIDRSNLYGFIIGLQMFDETGGKILDTDLYSGLTESVLAETIDSIYRSYQ